MQQIFYSLQVIPLLSNSNIFYFQFQVDDADFGSDALEPITQEAIFSSITAQGTRSASAGASSGRTSPNFDNLNKNFENNPNTFDEWLEIIKEQHSKEGSTESQSPTADSLHPRGVTCPSSTTSSLKLSQAASQELLCVNEFFTSLGSSIAQELNDLDAAERELNEMCSSHSGLPAATAS